MVNSDIPAGTYVIRPKDVPQTLFLTIGPHIPIEPPPDVPVDLGDKLPWVLKEIPGGIFTVQAEADRYKWVVKDDALFVSALGKVAEFTFTRSTTDSGFVFIDNYGFIDNRLTYHKDVLPPQPHFTFQETNGSSAQLFEVTRIFFEPSAGSTAN